MSRSSQKTDLEKKNGKLEKWNLSERYVFSIVRFSIATGAFSVNYSQKCLVMDLYHEKDGSVT